MVGPPKQRLAEAHSARHHRKVECGTTLPDTSLAIEDEQATRRQAELTRFQEVLGLSRKHAPRIYKYGDDLEALDADKPTGLNRERSVALVSMELEIRRDETGAATSIDIDVAAFGTITLISEPPKDFVTTVRNKSHTRRRRWSSNTALTESELGNVRYYIQGVVHPCMGANNHGVWASFDHTGHKQCFLNFDLVFIFSDKEATIRELKSLGYGLEQDFCTLDIYDLRELNAAYQARVYARTLGPMTAGKRTKIPESDQLPTRDEILKTTKCFSSKGEAGMPALDVLKAAVKRATDDATTAGWARTKQQIDGGLFSRPRKVRSEHDVAIAFLEINVARMGPSSKRVLDLTLEHELIRFRDLPARMQVAIMVNSAQRHGLTQKLAAFLRYKDMKQPTAQTVKLVQIATSQARVRKLIPPATDYTYQAPVVVSLDAAGKPTTAQTGRDTLRTGQSLPLNLVKLGLAYQKASRDISTRLVDFLESQFDSKPEGIRVQTRALYSIEEHTENGVRTKYPRMRSGGAFKSIAFRARQSGWLMDDEVAVWFITAIHNRRELRNWYDSLPSDDSRREENEKHEAWLQTMIEVVVILVGHRD